MKDRSAFKEVFKPYLEQFIERSLAADPGLNQVARTDRLKGTCELEGFSLKTSFGQGTPAQVSWLALFLPGQTAGVEGVYPVILFNRNLKRLAVCYGISETENRSEGKWPRSWPPQVASEHLKFDGPRYKASFVRKEFSTAELANTEQIMESFIQVADEYLALPATVGEAPTGTDLADLCRIAASSFDAAGFILADGVLERFVASLLAKRFLILTGLSGSGKTKLAQVFAAWISNDPDQHRIVPVGADWTTNENVLGYQDALRPEIYRAPHNGALELILSAIRRPQLPHFLILDEMNLSHVERYFSDILSAVESNQSISLHAGAEALPCGTDSRIKIPPTISLPENLFIVGTVNVDETTYMFSPKVLDRANVIEFRATRGQLEEFLDDPRPISTEKLRGKGGQYGEAMVRGATDRSASAARLDQERPGGDVALELKAHLVEAFSRLEGIGAEFGLRTAHEISRFVYFHATIVGQNWRLADALDAQVVQKILPKLHGSQRRLSPVLDALGKFCEERSLPISLEKVRRMQARLLDGYTSFAEA